MQFSNPAEGAAAAAPAYVKALLDLLGDREPLAQQRRLVADLRAALAGVPDALLRRAEAPGKWSMLEVVQHLVDTELVYGYRMRMIVAHDTPEIVGYDQDRWAARLRYHAVDLDDALTQLDVLRRMNHQLLDRLAPEDWERYGRHSERGPESIRHITRLIAGHDLVHLRQIERIQRALTAPTPSPA